MSAAPLAGVRVGYLEKPHPPGHRGLSAQLVPMLGAAGAAVDVVHAEVGLHRLDLRPAWDLVVLKSGSPAALHLAAAAEGWGLPCVNSSAATRLAQDRLSAILLLQQAGLPVPCSRAVWLNPEQPPEPAAFGGSALVVKAARGSQGQGIWPVQAAGLAGLVARLPAGPYLVMAQVAHEGHDLKVYAVGGWMTAIRRPFPAPRLEDKLGTPATLPAEVARATAEVGRLLGLTCWGCDFVCGPDGWVLVDVNAFPGYKGARGAATALLDEIVRTVQAGS